MEHTFDVGVWLTEQLENNGPGDPRQALDKFITSAIENTGNEVNLEIHSVNPAPPYEYLDGPGWPESYSMYCNGGFWGSYYLDSVWDYWYHYIDCKVDNPHSDINLLVTDHDSDAGATGGSCDDSDAHILIAEAHRCGKLADEPTDAEGSEPRYAQMYASVLHEIGHALIDEHQSAFCGEDPLNEEYMANSWYSSYDSPARCTPMASWEGYNDDGDYYDSNQCCDNLIENPYGTGTKIYWQPNYSQCVSDHVSSCNNR